MLVLRYIGIDAILAVVGLSMLFCQNVKAVNAEYRAHAELINKLFLGYDSVSHPTVNIKTPVNVTLGIAVAQLVRVDERMEGMNLNVWYRMAWKDYRLKWDPLEHGNITEFKIDSDYLWIPDILLYKPLTSDAGQVLGAKQHDDDLAWKIGVSSDGTASFNFPGSIYGQCSLTIADYPYDEHRCAFKFSSWVHDGSEIVLKLRSGNAMDFGNYVENNEWHIVGSEAKAIEEKFDCCPYPFYATSFNIHVRRGASSYVSNYIIPSILIAILSIMMFTLPPEVGKRMEIGINLLLCLSVYLTILNTKMPSRSDAFPLLSKFYGCCIFILTCALLCTCWVVAYYFHDMSGWKLYSMSKFVDVGVLTHLRRVLRFPNATKVYPSDILESVNTQRMIEVKPMMKEQTNFARDSPTNNPQCETNQVNKNTKVVENEKEDTKPVWTVAANNMKKIPTDRRESGKQSENSLSENNPRQKIITEKKYAADKKQNDRDLGKEDNKEKKKPKEGNLGKEGDKAKENDGTQGSTENKEEKKPKDVNLKDGDKARGNDGDQVSAENKEKKKPKKLKKLKELENLDKAKEDPAKQKEDPAKEKEDAANKTKEDPAAESEPKDSKKKKKKKKRKDENKEKRQKREESEEPVEKKRKPSVETEPDETRTVINPSENIRNARSASRESNSSETSKKSNNVFADTVAPGLVEKPKRERRKKKPKKEDLGIVNLGPENEDEGSKETGNKKEKVSEDVPSMCDVREAPSLKDKTEVTAGETKPSENVPALVKGQIFDKKIASDEGFDAKQAVKKKHDSIKLLKELATYFSDHLERKKNRYQWRQAAIVLNRLFLIILCISIAMSIFLVFLAR